MKGTKIVISFVEQASTVTKIALDYQLAEDLQRILSKTREFYPRLKNVTKDVLFLMQQQMRM